MANSARAQHRRHQIGLLLHRISIVPRLVGKSAVRKIERHDARKTLRQRSEEHTSELQSLMRISYAVFCLKKKNKKKHTDYQNVNIHKTSIIRHSKHILI